MRSKQLLVYLFISLLLASSCQRSPANGIPRQGITGKVLWLEGNQMPSIGGSVSKALPIKCKIYICNPLTSNELEGMMPLFEKPSDSQIVAIAESGTNGTFSVEVPPGNYSILAETPEGKFFAKRMNGQGILCPITVVSDKLSETEIRMDYKAVY